MGKLRVVVWVVRLMSSSRERMSVCMVGFCVGWKRVLVGVGIFGLGLEVKVFVIGWVVVVIGGDG